MSGRRASNPRPAAWKAAALPIELLPLLTMLLNRRRIVPKTRVGRAGFEPAKSKDNRFTVCPSWPLWYLPNHPKNHSGAGKKKRNYAPKVLWKCKSKGFSDIFKLWAGNLSKLVTDSEWADHPINAVPCYQHIAACSLSRLFHQRGCPVDECG